MRKFTFCLLSLAVTLGTALYSERLRAQTVQGDILRGEGRFLAGAGWYNLNTARAERINVESWKSYNREVQRLYRDYMIDRYQHIQYRKGLTNKTQAEYQRLFEEAQSRWRTNPTPADITSGDALNALASDLADPSIAPSEWRSLRVDLPTGMSLTTLAFKVADRKKSALMQSTVAVERMLVKDGWPLPFRRPELDAECNAYEKAIAVVVDKCRNGTALQAADYDHLRDSVSALASKVETAIPARDNQRTQSRAFVKRLDEATRIFAEQTYAEHLIRDVSEHKATTVAELLGFMRQYQLLFSDPGDSPEVESLYEGLYGLLRQQLDVLGAGRPAAAAPATVKAPEPTDRLRAGSVWTGTIVFNDDDDDDTPKKAQTKKAKKAAAKKAAGSPYRLVVKERDGPRIVGESTYMSGVTRKLEGTIDGNRIKYQETDGGRKGYAIDGTIQNNVIVFKFEGIGPRGRSRSGEGRLMMQ